MGQPPAIDGGLIFVIIITLVLAALAIGVCIFCLNRKKRKERCRREMMEQLEAGRAGNTVVGRGDPTEFAGLPAAPVNDTQQSPGAAGESRPWRGGKRKEKRSKTPARAQQPIVVGLGGIANVELASRYA